MKLYVMENGEPVEAQVGDSPTHGLLRLEDLSGALHAAWDAGRRAAVHHRYNGDLGQHATVARLMGELQ